MAADPGSFRDPASRVVRADDGRILRQGSGFEAFLGSPFADDPRVVRTWLVDDATLEHERVPFWSYPYEWTFGMLRAAALLQLDLLDEAIGHGLSLKDATPYNVQFVDGAPVFVDVGSFEALRPQPWVAYRQFCCLYLYPLLLSAYRGVPFQSFLRASLEGIEPAVAASLLPRWRRGVPVNARLLARLERRTGETTARETTGRLTRAGYRPELIQAQVRRLRRLVARLSVAGDSAWSAYAPDEGKLAFVVAAAERVRPALAWDLGANDGTFARAVAPHAGLVVAMDADPFALPEPSGNVLPLVMDVCDPSPARGWALRERASLLDRGRPQLTLSLALVHHLAISRTVPPAAIVAWLAALGGVHVIEVPTREDPLVQRLLAAKRDDFPYSLEAFEAAIAERFTVHRRETIGTRVLLEAASAGCACRGRS